MIQRHRLFGFLSTLCTGILVSVCAAQSANVTDEIRLGRQALSHAQYDDAIEHFEKAVSMAPRNVGAHLDLATAYAQKYVPGLDKPENVALRERAIDHYQNVLDLDAVSGASLRAAEGIAFLNAQMNKFDEAKSYYGKAKELDPSAPEPYYLTAVIDWTMASQFRQQERARLGLKPEDALPIKNREVCAAVRLKNWPNLEEGLDNLNKALELRPKYPDAMTYMSMVYRERADIECNDPASHKADLQAAGEWEKKALLAKQVKAPAQQPAPQR
jgi:tetratricopeptide (TPR) repeat protein